MHTKYKHSVDDAEERHHCKGAKEQQVVLWKKTRVTLRIANKNINENSDNWVIITKTKESTISKLDTFLTNIDMSIPNFNRS